MLDRNNVEEARHDRERADQAQAAAPYLAQALDDVVERVMQGGVVGYPKRLDLWGFLEDQSDLPELLAKIITATSTDGRTLACAEVESWIEERLRAHLKDSEIVTERADEMARDEEEERLS